MRHEGASKSLSTRGSRKTPTFFRKSPTFFLKRPTCFLKAPIVEGIYALMAGSPLRCKGENSRWQFRNKDGPRSVRSVGTGCILKHCSQTTQYEVTLFVHLRLVFGTVCWRANFGSFRQKPCCYLRLEQSCRHDPTLCARSGKYLHGFRATALPHFGKHGALSHTCHRSYAKRYAHRRE